MRFWSPLLNKGENEDKIMSRGYSVLGAGKSGGQLAVYPTPSLPSPQAGWGAWFIHHLLRCLPELSLLHSVAVKNCLTEQAFASRSGLVLSVAMLSCLQAFFFPCNVVKCRFLFP